MASRWEDEDIGTLMAMLKDGATQAQIAFALGRSEEGVKQFIHRGGIQKALARGIGPARRVVQVPRWVPADIHQDYLEIARQEGEFAAASWARAEKRAMAA